jgi:hypothetical protein
MKAIVYLTALESMPPSSIQMLGVDQDAVLVTATITTEAYRWLIEESKKIYGEKKQRVAFLDIIGEDKRKSLSKIQLINISERDYMNLVKISKLALEHPELLPADGKIPLDLFNTIQSIIKEGLSAQTAFRDQITDRENTISDALNAEQIWQQEQEGELILDVYGKCCLAVCIWRMGIQLKGRNTYVILVYKDGSLQLYNIELGPVPIKNAREAFKYLFGANVWVELQATRPKPTLKGIVSDVADLINAKHISFGAIIPSREEPHFCLCLERINDFLRVGLMFPEGPRMARLKMDESEARKIAERIARISTDFLNSTSQKDPDDLQSLEYLYKTTTTKNIGISKNIERLHGARGGEYV